MTKIKKILDDLNIDSKDRYGEEIENIDIGNYSFDNVHEKGYIIEFTSNSNPDTILRINEDIMNVILLNILDENEVKATSWTDGVKRTKIFPRERLKV